MLVGGIGYCDVGGDFQFHKNQFESLQVHNDSILYGIAHPKPKYAEDEDTDPLDRYHFAVTPIPYHLWPRTGRLIIRFANNKDVDGQTTGLQMVTDFLAKKKVSIIFSSSIRSGHRYSVWDVHICFDDITNDYLMGSNEIDPSTNHFKDSRYERDKSCFPDIESKLDDLEKAIETEDEKWKVLFRDSKEKNLSAPVISRVNTSLHYFFYESERMQKNQPANAYVYKAFRLRYKNGNLTLEEQGRIQGILRVLGDNEKAPQTNRVKDAYLPSFCFANADSHYLNVRIIIIPTSQQKRFFKLSIFHDRNKDLEVMNDNSRGLMSYILKEFSSTDYKIWKTSTLIYECRDNGNDGYCRGKLSIFIEVNRNFDDQTAEDEKARLVHKIDQLSSEDSRPKELRHLRLMARAERLDPDIIGRYFRSNRKRNQALKYDVFISYSHSNSEHAKFLYRLLVENGCKAYLDNRILGGEVLTQKIHEGLIESRELCLLLSPNSWESKWVTTEWGAAWALNKHITPILIDYSLSSLPADVDTRIKQLHCIKWPADGCELVDRYVKHVLDRRFQSLLSNNDYNY